jgi:MFS family permease
MGCEALNGEPTPALRQKRGSTRVLWAAFGQFFASGVVFASWAARIPEVRDRIHAPPSQLGLALLGIAAGALAAMPLGGRASRRWGSRRVLAGGSAIALCALPLLALAPNVAILGGLLTLFGLGFGTWDVAMNIQGVEIEKWSERPLMARLHAGFSVGGVVGALIGAGASAAKVPVFVHLLVAAALLVALMAVARPPAFTGSRIDDSAGRQPATGRLLSARLLLLMALIFCAAVCEGAAVDWLGLFLVDERAAPSSLAATGFAFFIGAMAVGRLAGPPLTVRFGRVRLLRIGAGLALAGVVVTVAGPNLATSVVGAVVWGLGLAVAFPLAISAAGETPGRGPDSIAVVATCGYAGFLSAPPMVGFLAEVGGLGRALATAGVLAVAILVFARAVGPAPEAAEPSLLSSGAAEPSPLSSEAAEPSPRNGGAGPNEMRSGHAVGR